jgi:Holliday junction resolvasome RuvABC endonuclease subunit
MGRKVDEDVVLGLDVASATHGFVTLRRADVAKKDRRPTLDAAQQFRLKAGEGTQTQRWSAVSEAVSIIIANKYPALVVLEAYAGKPPNLGTFIEQVSTGAVLRYFLTQWAMPWIEVSPATLKKFMTGSGSAQKSDMKLNVYKMLGLEFKTEDEADACALAAFGAVVLGHFPVSKERGAVVAPFRSLVKLTTNTG